MKFIGKIPAKYDAFPCSFDRTFALPEKGKAILRMYGQVCKPEELTMNVIGIKFAVRSWL